MASDDFPLINDPHAPMRHPDAESVNGGDYYTSYADSDQDQSGSGAPATPSSKRNHQSHQRHYYYNNDNNNKKHKSNSNNIETEVNTTNTTTADYRKDREEWSDTAISCLLEVYTDKYNQLNRGNLRGRDWEEVAEAVSERGGGNNKKSVEQCKNKIDNLKKRYKVELQRINNSNNGGFGSNATSSSWHWFKQIEAIMGNSSNAKAGGGGESECGVGGSGGNCNLVTRPIKRYMPNNVAFENNLKAKSMPNLKWRRVVFKISGAALAGNCHNIDPKVAMQIAREVATACRVGLEVAIVVGGRNFFCGDSWISATGLERPTAYQIGIAYGTVTARGITSMCINKPISDGLQELPLKLVSTQDALHSCCLFYHKLLSMMATVMNSVLLQSALEKLGVQTRVQSAFAMPELVEPYSRQRAVHHLEKGRVVIFGGVGAGAGNPLFTTDTAAALRASENALLKGTNVDGIYDCHSGNTNMIMDHLSFREVVSRGVAFMDMMAITYCEENGIPVVIFNLLEPGNVSRALCGDQVGTLIDQAGRIS